MNFRYYQTLTNDEYKNISDEVKHMTFELYHGFQNVLDASDDWYQTSCASSSEYWECKGNQMLTWKDKGYKTVLDLLQVVNQFSTSDSQSIL